MVVPILRRAKTFAASDVIGICIARHAQGHHLGVLYAGEDGQFLLHQAWDCIFERDPPDDRYLWVPTGWPVERLMLVSNLCDELWRRYRTGSVDKLRYAFAYHDGLFEMDGAFVTNGGKGLTCSTFVMALFASVGLKLIVATQWPSGRVGDDEMVNWVAARVRPHDSEHADAILNERGCVRYRPSEVAGGAMCRPPPASFVDAATQALTVVKALEACEPLF